MEDLGPRMILSVVGGDTDEDMREIERGMAK
jgi:hypothetical protein